MASSLDQALDEAVRSVPDCLVAGYVDLTTGVMLGVKTADNQPREALDLVSSAVADLFDNDNLAAAETWLLDGHGDEGGDPTAYREFVIMSDRLLHMYTRCKDNNDHVVVLVARRSANVGMLIAKSRKAADFVYNTS